MLNQKGISILTTILILAILAIVAFVFYRIIDSRGQTPIITGLNVFNNPYPDLQSIKNDPALMIQPADAKVLRNIGADRSMTPEGPLPAFYGVTLGTQEPVEQIHGFYQQELDKLGWVSDPQGVVRTTDDLAVWGWCKPSKTFLVANEDQSQFDPSLYQGQHFQTVITAEIRSKNPNESCPYQTSGTN